MYGRPPTGSLANRPASRATSSWNKAAPRTAMPPQTGRIPPRTGMQRINPMDRPTTQQGLGGIKTKSQGPGRQIQDITYFQSELRQRLNALVDESKKLSQQLDQQQKDNQHFQVFEKKADGLAQELRDLQNQLGDLNTLVDKLHTDTDLLEFEKEFVELQSKNKKVTEELDGMFLNRQQREQQIREMEQLILSEQSKQESQIDGLDPERKEAFMKLKRENQEYLASIQTHEQSIDELQRQAMKMEQELSQNSMKQRAMVLFQKLWESKQRNIELQTSLNQQTESGPQERERLLAQVKNDNLETSGMERKISEMEEKIRVLKDKIAVHSMEQDSNNADKVAKYQELVKKDKEMQEFLETFDERKQQSEKRNEQAQEQIVELLGRIQQLSKHDTKNMPTKQEYQSLNQDVTMKMNEAKRAEMTAEQLIAERDQRMSDLEKVGLLEVKLDQELSQLSQKIEGLKQQIQKMDNVEEHKAQVESQNQEKAGVRNSLKQKNDTMRSEIISLTAQYDAKRNQLFENETFTQLNAQEQKMKQLEAIVFELSDYVASKNAESNYKPLQKDVLELMDNINTQILKMMQMTPSRS